MGILEPLRERGIAVQLVNVTRIKPLPDELEDIVRGGHARIYCLEDHAAVGGLGDQIAHRFPEHHVRRLGWPQSWLPATTRGEDSRGRHGLDTAGLVARIEADRGAQGGATGPQ